MLVEQNPHWQGQHQNFIKRQKLAQLIEYLPLRQIITITGIRRCGKSSLARQAINYLIEQGTAAQNILFVNLEQPVLLEYKHDANHLNTIYATYLQLMNPQGRVYVILDEVQFFDNWQVFVKSKYENTNIKFIITGSNSSMLSHDLNTLLSGRSLNIHLDTFSFVEFLNYKQIDFSTALARIANKIAIARAKDEYLKWGGFYEVFSIENETIKKELLISYAKNIIYQDIIPRYGLRHAEVVERLFFYLLSHVTGSLNYSVMARTFDITDKTVKEYISYFEDVFLLKRIDKHHNKLKERNTSFKKIYALDNGLLQIAPQHSKNLGQKLENWVFNILIQNDAELRYLRDVYEIDFLSGSTLYQVAYHIDDEKTRKRELQSFNHFKTAQRTNCRLITYETTAMVDDVEVISVEDFIFNPSL